jgi:hypothetical protein
MSNSRVDLTHFDRDGVDELRRTLSQASRPALGQSASAERQSSSGHTTLAADDATFDLEKTLGDVLQRLAHM